MIMENVIKNTRMYAHQPDPKPTVRILILSQNTMEHVSQFLAGSLFC